MGSTSLFSGDRVPKSDMRVELYGTVDELNAAIAIALEFDIHSELASDLRSVVHDLFILGADFATPATSPAKPLKIDRIEEKHVVNLENKIDRYSAVLPPIHAFILPGGTKASAFLNQARTICRRAERIAVKFNTNNELTEYSVKYLNRLSDYLYTAMRYANYMASARENTINFSTIV